MERKYPTGADWYVAQNLPVPDKYLNPSDPDYQGGRRSGGQGQRHGSKSPAMPILTPPRQVTPPRATPQDHDPEDVAVPDASSICERGWYSQAEAN